MQSQTIGLLVGGIAPALLLGLSALCQKAAAQSGAGAVSTMLVAGVGIVCTALVAAVVFPGNVTLSGRSGMYAALYGIIWCTASIGIMLALGRYGVPVGKLVPLFNMNTLVAVVLALWIFSEWRTVNVPQLLLGAVLVAAGGVIVARA
jgi:transporter family protein